MAEQQSNAPNEEPNDDDVRWRKSDVHAEEVEPSQAKSTDEPGIDESESKRRPDFEEPAIKTELETEAGKKATVTFVGPTQSGKSHILAAIGFSGKVGDDLRHPNGPNRVSRGSFTLEGEDGSLATPEVRALRDRFDEMLLAKPSGNTATQELIEYQMTISVTVFDGVDTQKENNGWGWPRKEAVLDERPEPEHKRTIFKVIDGRGGDLTMGRYRYELQKEERNFIHAHYDALLDSIGAVICLPWRSRHADKDDHEDEIQDREIDGLENLFKQQAFANETKLEHIAVCLSKYELAFLNLGRNAYKNATSSEAAMRRIRKSGYTETFFALEELQSAVANRRNLKVYVFPCSTYGFVGGNGASNFYPAKDFQGLLTRQIHAADHVANAELRDHFPDPLPSKVPQSLWYPFNLGSPFYFAATGLVTGPLAFDLADVLGAP
ncbi:hypothetical protein AIOL_001864 [Candidatus Rhodobacter oscarellae]|uniref:Uncharacterized protein n=1 Tax=Candidatus Rhodobacter oscarellae TaxID=1675527 RepID=A0A0J9E2I9_9RHOB|nr:hypothetical protein [Candidatus Rhodobacter lobularis]KMW56907.1 hypothetical protein AIOL_001864 [Candidatus Rhodobacter lobularis]